MGSTQSQTETKSDTIIISQMEEFLSIMGGNMKGPIVLENQSLPSGSQLAQHTPSGPTLRGNSGKLSLAGDIVGNNVLAAKSLPFGSSLTFTSTCSLLYGKAGDTLLLALEMDEKPVWKQALQLTGKPDIQIKIQVDLISTSDGTLIADGVIFQPDRLPIMSLAFNKFDWTKSHALNFTGEFLNSDPHNALSCI